MDGVKKLCAHVDINSYFATVIQQENPRLRNRPVGIIKNEGRTCIIAASKEAKKLGIKTGCNQAQAYLLAPDIILVPAAFDIYLDCTRKLQTIFTSLAPEIDIFSLDEAFIDLSDCRNFYPDLKKFGRLVQRKIKQELGDWVTANVGIGPTRLLAKLAGEISPKGSVTIINDKNKNDYLIRAGFADICGIGRGLSKKLLRLQITNPYQLNFYSQEELELYFGSFWSKELLKIAQGHDSLTLQKSSQRKNQQVKSVSRSITGYHLSDDEEEIKQVLYNLCAEVGSKVRSLQMAGRHVGVYLSGQGQSWHQHKTFSEYFYHTSRLFEVIYHQFYSVWERNFKVIKFGVYLNNLRPMVEVPRGLFVQDQQRDLVTTAVDSVNQRYGLFTVRSGTLANSKLFHPEVTGFLGDRRFWRI